MKKYYSIHYKQIIIPLLISKYTYNQVNLVPIIKSATFIFNTTKYKRIYLSLIHYLFCLLRLSKATQLHYTVAQERAKVLKKAIRTRFYLRMTNHHLFWLLEYFIVCGFGGIIHNPFLFKKPSGLHNHIFLTNLYYKNSATLFWPEPRSVSLFLQNQIALQVHIAFKKNKHLLVLEKWNILRLLNIPVMVK